MEIKSPKIQKLVKNGQIRLALNLSECENTQRSVFYTWILIHIHKIQSRKKLKYKLAIGDISITLSDSWENTYLVAINIGKDDSFKCTKYISEIKQQNITNDIHKLVNELMFLYKNKISLYDHILDNVLPHDFTNLVNYNCCYESFFTIYLLNIFGCYSDLKSNPNNLIVKFKIKKYNYIIKFKHKSSYSITGWLKINNRNSIKSTIVGENSYFEFIANICKQIICDII